MRNTIVLICLSLLSFNMSRAQNSLRWNILSLGKQFNNSNIPDAKFSRFDKNRSPTSSAGFMYKHQFKTSSKNPYWLGIQLSYESGKIGRGFEYTMKDSFGEMHYTSGIDLKYLSYGLGIHGGIQFGKHNNINFNINYYTFSAQSYKWFDEFYNETSQTITLIANERINDLDEYKSFVQAGIEYERYLDKEHIHSLILTCSKSFNRPIYGGQTVMINNQTIENYDYKLNYGNIRIGYCYNIYIKRKMSHSIN